jgi:hypothetical protein
MQLPSGQEAPLQLGAQGRGLGAEDVAVGAGVGQQLGDPHQHVVAVGGPGRVGDGEGVDGIDRRRNCGGASGPGLATLTVAPRAGEGAVVADRAADQGGDGAEDDLLIGARLSPEHRTGGPHTRRTGEAITGGGDIGAEGAGQARIARTTVDFGAGHAVAFEARGTNVAAATFTGRGHVEANDAREAGDADTTIDVLAAEAVALVAGRASWALGTSVLDLAGRALKTRVGCTRIGGSVDRIGVRERRVRERCVRERCVREANAGVGPGVEAAVEDEAGVGRRLTAVGLGFGIFGAAGHEQKAAEEAQGSHPHRLPRLGRRPTGAPRPLGLGVPPRGREVRLRSQEPAG